MAELVILVCVIAVVVTAAHFLFAVSDAPEESSPLPSEKEPEVVEEYSLETEIEGILKNLKKSKDN